MFCRTIVSLVVLMLVCVCSAETTANATPCDHEAKKNKEDSFKLKSVTQSMRDFEEKSKTPCDLDLLTYCGLTNPASQDEIFESRKCLLSVSPYLSNNCYNYLHFMAPSFVESCYDDIEIQQCDNIAPISLRKLKNRDHKQLFYGAYGNRKRSLSGVSESSTVVEETKDCLLRAKGTSEACLSAIHEAVINAFSDAAAAAAQKATSSSGENKTQPISKDFVEEGANQAKDLTEEKKQSEENLLLLSWPDAEPLEKNEVDYSIYDTIENFFSNSFSGLVVVFPNGDDDA
jgi:hypothetical protein